MIRRSLSAILLLFLAVPVLAASPPWTATPRLYGVRLYNF
jgi:hypothetical protein